MIKVTEDPGGLNYDTHYSYDAHDNLRLVAQGSQTRTFVYDSLSRLISATNPENGTMTYAYDPNGNLIEKTDARGVRTTMTYKEYLSTEAGRKQWEKYANDKNFTLTITVADRGGRSLIKAP